MDEYTQRTRAWLEQIYSGPPPGFGDYVPHSPIGGLSFRARYLGTYAHLYAILRRLRHYSFRSALDVGAGEGFLAQLVTEIFGARCFATDLALHACRRARERVEHVVCAHALELPFKDNCVDVVISVNTLEHIRPIHEAVEELERVARHLLVVALPHARMGQAPEPPTEPHAHVSLLTRAQMQTLFGARAQIFPSLSRLVRPLYALVAEDDVREQPRYRWLARPPWNAVYRLARSLGYILPRRFLLRWLCRIEYAAAQLFPWWTYESIVIIELDSGQPPERRIGEREILLRLLAPARPARNAPAARN
ncbi:MAG: class I SAM-dependent methyltransferase [Candidatus Binatia bacterium]|nr:class I SAM-dependent methyltransferase [Candidatus Binatia bacterium]